MVKPLSERLINLMYFCKTKYNVIDSEEIIKQALGDLYHPSMNKSDIFEHTLKGCLELLENPCFPDRKNMYSFMDGLIKAPYKKTLYEIRRPSLEPNTSITFDSIYEAQLHYLITYIALSNISNCQQFIDFFKQKNDH